MRKFFIGTAAAVLFVFCISGCGASYITAQAAELSPEEAAGTAGETSDDLGNQYSDSADQSDTANPSAATSTGTIFVQITGQVLRPGVYEMPSGSRLYELVEMAGGMLPDAAENDINQVELLSDGQLVKIPTEAEFKLQQEVLAEEEAGLINLNTASIADLCTLPGIGEGKANAVITYREEHGGFSSKEELMNVSGIGESTFARLEQYITVR